MGSTTPGAARALDGISGDLYSRPFRQLLLLLSKLRLALDPKFPVAQICLPTA